MMSSASPKRAVFAQFAVVAQALANGHRVELIELVAQGERSVEELARLVVARRSGKQVLYRLADRDVVDLLMAVRHTAERGVAEIDKIVQNYFHARDSLEPVSHDELANRLRDGVVTLIDVRPGEEFAAGHIPGAVNIPLDELPRRLGELPADRTIIAYCRGPYCVFAFEAVATLRAQGYDARRLADGYPQWWAARRPVAAAVA
jgi:rhodanese-related sulfurtransferase